MKKIVIFMCVLLVSSIVFLGCGAKQEVAEENASKEVLFEEENITYASVETPYGELKFMEKWKDLMIVEQTEDGENLIVSFKTKIEEETYSLFDIMIGEFEEEAAAEVKDSEGNIKNVYVTMYEIPADLDMSEKDRNQLYAMQEEINSIISFLE